MESIYRGFAAVKSGFSEVFRVLIAYPIFLIALAFLALYALLSCMSQLRDYTIDCMCDYIEKQE
jgi:hypothetical protein